MSSNRNRYLVSYDICDAKRLRKVASVIEGFGHRLQYSLFECPLTEMKYAELKSALAKVIEPSEDQVLFVSLGTTEKDPMVLIASLGLPYTERTMVSIV